MQTAIMSRSARKRLETLFDNAFYRLAGGVQFNVMDLGALRNFVVQQHLVHGFAFDDAMREGIAKYRKN